MATETQRDDTPKEPQTSAQRTDGPLLLTSPCVQSGLLESSETAGWMSLPPLALGSPFPTLDWKDTEKSLRSLPGPKKDLKNFSEITVLDKVSLGKKLKQRKIRMEIQAGVKQRGK